MEIARRLYPVQPVDLVAVFSDPKLLDAARAQFEPLVHPDFETVNETSQLPLGGQDPEMRRDSSRPTSFGVEGFLAAWRDWLSAWESWVVTPAEFIDVDEERVLVLLDIRARSKRHQAEMPTESANLLTLRDGKLTRLELFLQREEALEAAGLSE